MAMHTCCHATTMRTEGKSIARRVLGTTRWIAPTVILALLPKCPMCLAAYVALATGIGISLPVAAWIRTGLLLACLGALAWFTLSTLRHRISFQVPFTNSHRQS